MNNSGYDLFGGGGSQAKNQSRKNGGLHQDSISNEKATIDNRRRNETADDDWVKEEDQDETNKNNSIDIEGSQTEIKIEI